MKRWKLLIIFAAILFLCVGIRANAATMTMSMVTDQDENPATPDVVEQSGEVPLYYETYSDGHGEWHVGYDEEDPRYDPAYPGYDWVTEEGQIHLDPGEL